ncbi:TPA: DUF4760 domain-containing protein [Stenotrophomonas maltophilia]|nr:DUF4760 domain-containing protein [Stenotrophomonas maltophilia]
MERIFTDLKFAPVWSWLSLVVSLVTLTLACSGAYQAKAVVLLAVVSQLGLGAFLAPTVFRAAKKGHKHVPTVCAWTVVWLATAVATFLYWFFNWPGFNANDQNDRILNVVPVLTAIVFGGLGWYVHYQFSARTQRMNSSFALVMEMMKSSEYLARNALVSDHFPSSVEDIPDEYIPYFAPGAEKRLKDAATADEPLCPIKLEQARAIAALRYILNYFEFMAVGVRANDIDCDLLLDTVGQIVVSRFKRSQKLVKWIRDPKPLGAGQDLAFEHLEWMCRDWEPRLEEQTSKAKQRLLGRQRVEQR